MDNRPIGIFDSGVGGLTVVKEVIRELPFEETIYFGDTARVPYGTKSKETVTKFSSQIIRFLKSKDVKAVIIACNTVSSNCYEELKEEFSELPIIEVVGPGVESCVKTTKNNIVGIIGTEATVRSGAYEKRIKEIKPEIEVYSKACPLFVQLAEEGWTNNEVTKKTAEIYLKELVERGIDSIILGCTHYPLLKACIGETVGENVKIVNPAAVTAKRMKKYLQTNNMLNDGNTEKHTFYVSDNSEKFSTICSVTLKNKYNAVKVDIEKY